MHFSICQVKPLLSVDNAEARLRVLALYKAWYRQLPFMVDEYDIPVTVKQSKETLKVKFQANSHVRDARVIDMLVFKVHYYYYYYTEPR
jgi:NADH dehydrogenase (ubiquinone) 1 alpha subcomplex subunit 6